MKLKLNLNKIISLILLVSIVVLFITYYIHGGDAISGKIEHGKYFVFDAINKSDAKGNKLFLNVSKGEYYFNLFMTFFVFSLMPFFFLFKVKEFIKNKKLKERL
ncbi:hypothetical protein EYY60_15765 [Flavobacterium zhairuonense]|uniref:hypothetical protein n=1 Tax=Flavobacterium zhairuonense TaxID=2493631 RepID=UPI00104D1FC5|nr:hypothetical protein [Flavobacterium zhairuonense]KAF2508583.1 hypothetical protein EYY60_15765 [Flavobacterium zhairuonense]